VNFITKAYVPGVVVDRGGQRPERADQRQTGRERSGGDRQDGPALGAGDAEQAGPFAAGERPADRDRRRRLLGVRRDREGRAPRAGRNRHRDRDGGCGRAAGEQRDDRPA
jgi:hypothetical protein